MFGDFPARNTVYTPYIYICVCVCVVLANPNYLGWCAARGSNEEAGAAVFQEWSISVFCDRFIATDDWTEAIYGFGCNVGKRPYEWNDGRTRQMVLCVNKANLTKHNCTHTLAHTLAHTHTHTRTHTHTHTDMHTQTITHAITYIHTCKHKQSHTHSLTRVCAHILFRICCAQVHSWACQGNRPQWPAISTGVCVWVCVVYLLPRVRFLMSIYRHSSLM